MLGAIFSFKAHFEQNVSMFKWEILCKQIHFSSPVVYSQSPSVLDAHFIFLLLPLHSQLSEMQKWKEPFEV